MKKLLAATFVALLMVGCGGPDDEENSFGWSDAKKPASTGVIDLDDNETRNRIAAEAIDSGKLQKKGEEGDQLFYAPNQQTPYTGLAKVMYDNGQIHVLTHYKNGKQDGLLKAWHENGQKQFEANYKDGKEDGLFIVWNENGTEIYRKTYKDGERVKDYRAKPKLFGGLEVLAKIKEVKESGATELDLDDNQISDLSLLAGLTQLERLELSDNQISDLSPLAGLTQLERLELSDNRISDLSPLKGLTNLKWLNLHGNQISDLSPLAGLTNLEVPWLSKNKITDLSPLKGLTNLKWLWLRDNQITDDQKEMLRKALPNCKISFEL